MHRLHPVEVRDLAVRSKKVLVSWVGQIEDAEKYSNPCLGSGCALNALILSSSASATGSSFGTSAAAQHLARGAKLYESIPLSSSLYGGVVGFGWALQNCGDTNPLPWRDKFLLELDEILADAVEASEQASIDIINGIAGIGVYAVSRGRSSTQSDELWSALEENIAEHLKEWRQRAKLSRRRSSAATNLGMAHGYPGLLAVTIAAIVRGAIPACRSDLVEDGLDFLWDQRIETKDGIFFPTVYRDTTPSRLAWCYGNLGLAALFNSGANLFPKNAERLSRLCESATTQYFSGKHLMRDASLCHGYAGAALSFWYLAKSIWLEQGQKNLLYSAAYDACSRALDCEVTIDGRSTFYFAKKEGLLPSENFLEGGAGIALSLNAIFDSKPHTWLELIGYYDQEGVMPSNSPNDGEL